MLVQRVGVSILNNNGGFKWQFLALDDSLWVMGGCIFCLKLRHAQAGLCKIYFKFGFNTQKIKLITRHLRSLKGKDVNFLTVYKVVSSVVGFFPLWDCSVI